MAHGASAHFDPVHPSPECASTGSLAVRSASSVCVCCSRRAQQGALQRRSRVCRKLRHLMGHTTMQYR